MERRTNMVILQAGETKQEFEINHAERILRMPNNGGWHLPEDSNYLMDKLNGLTVKRDKGTIKKS
jgi:hypothetical protein